MLWNLARLTRRPRQFPAPGFSAAGVKALFYEGEPFGGRPTRVFAWYGAPPVARGERLPAMVLVHGGGGTAFPDWVRLWNARGYAALALDTCGGVPAWHETPYSNAVWPRHARSGPNGWGGFAEAGRVPPRDQWMYHAVAAVVRGHSLLRTFPEVDPARIGVTGVSWGGVLTCVAAGIDPRFRFAAPVYGCGFLDSSATRLHDGRAPAQWFKWWDPRQYLARARLPKLWVNGTNDTAFPLDMFQRSYELAPGERTLAVRVRMPHAHGGAGERPEEIRVFADALTRGGAPLPRVTGQGRRREECWVAWDAAVPVAGVEFNFTRATGDWTDRQWNTVPAKLVDGGGRATVPVPRGRLTGFFNVLDARGCVASSPHRFWR